MQPTPKGLDLCVRWNKTNAFDYGTIFRLLFLKGAILENSIKGISIWRRKEWQNSLYAVDYDFEFFFLYPPQVNMFISQWPLWNSFRALKYPFGLGEPQTPFRYPSPSQNTFWSLRLSSSRHYRQTHHSSAQSQTSSLTITVWNASMERCAMCSGSLLLCPIKWNLRRSPPAMP